MKQSEIAVVPMQSAHVPQVAELERQCFSDPWPEEILAGELKNPLSLWLVAVKGQKVVGYIGSQSVMGEADMMNLAVHPDFCRQGIAEQLAQTLMAHLRHSGVKTLCLEVRVSNASAIALYQKLGFAEVGCRPRYYFHPTENALIFKKKLGETDENIGN